MSSSRTFIPSSLAKNIEPLNYPDCVHLTEHGKRRVLNIGKCKAINCSHCPNNTQDKSFGKIYREIEPSGRGKEGKNFIFILWRKNAVERASL